MFRKLIFLTSCLLLVGLANAATVWNPAANGIVPPATGNWNVAANWTNDVPGVVDNKGVFNVPGAAECVVTDAQALGDFVQGDGADGGVVRIQNGGSITTTGGWAGIGYNSTANLVVEDGGTMNFGGHSWIGFRAGAVGTVDINGGTVNVAGMFGLGWDAGDGYVNVNDGGLLALSNIHGDGATSIKQASLLSINGTGAVTLPGDFVGVIDAYAAAGLIAGDGVLGAVQAVFADDVTTVTAVHPLIPTVDIPIVNAGFEDPAYDDSVWGPTTGWTVGYYDVTDPGVWVVDDSDDAGGYNPSPAEGFGGIAPDGENVAYTTSYVGYDCGLRQVLSDTLQANTQYDLSALVGNPVEYNWGPTADYCIELLAGGVVLASDTGPSPLDDTTWTTASLTFNPGASHAQLGQTLEIRLLAVDFDDTYEVDFDDVKLTAAEPGVTIHVDPNGDIAAANELAQPGDTIEFAEGTYYLTSQIEIKDGVTYKGAGPGLTIIDGNDVTRAFVAWGDRGATDGQVDVNGVSVPNLTGPTDWVLDGLTIQNCVSDANNRQNILSASRDLLNNYTGTPYMLATAQEENGGVTDNPEWFDILSGSADPNLTDVELQAYLDGNPVGSAGHLVVNDDKRDDGGAVLILSSAAGTIRNCTFSTNAAVDDGGAIMVDNVGLNVAIDNCTFDLNTCGDEGGAIKLSGNASIYTVTDTTFTECYAGDDGGAIRADGDDSSYVLTGCTITGCYASDDGAAVRYGTDRAELIVTNCAFIGNGKDPNGTVVGDDSVWSTHDDDAGSMTFINCLFADNACNDDRLIELKAAFALINCTFIGNVAGDKPLIAVRGRPWDSTGDGVDDVITDDSIISNCLFINNTMLSDSRVIGDTRNDVFVPTVTNCLFFGNLDGTNPATNTNDASPEVGTIDVSTVTDAAQIVVDPAGDYHPVAGSPAIDASDPATATDTDIEGTAAVGVRDVGAYEAPAN